MTTPFPKRSEIHEIRISGSVVPADVKTAAKAAFVRTTSQAYSTALAGGISATLILSLIRGEASWLEMAITWAVAIVSPLLAGVAAYLSVVAAGIPEAYQPTLEITPESDQR